METQMNFEEFEETELLNMFYKKYLFQCKTTNLYIEFV